MKLVSVLVSGVNGAENGHAELYERGTATRADYYLDFDGDTAITNGANVSLDAHGGAVVYVNEYVDVIVKSAGGATIRNFTLMDQATVVECMSPSFTGVDYDTAASAPGNPVTLKAILDRLFASTGAVDFQVIVGGVPVNIDDAFASFAGLFYNVKAPEYGALGNGVTDDTAAIQDAMDAADAAGGGIVFLPAGTYIINGALEPTDRVSIWGANSRAVEIRGMTGGERIISQQSSGAGRHSATIQGVTLRHGVGATAECVVVATTLEIRGTQLGGSTFGGGTMVSIAASGICRVTGCSIAANVASDSIIIGAGGAVLYLSETYVTSHNSSFAPTSGAIYVPEAHIVSCRFQDLGAASGAYAWFLVDGSGAQRVRVTGCHFIGGAGSPVAFDLDTLTDDHSFVETNNTFTSGIGAGVTPYEVNAADVICDQMILGSRESRVSAVATALDGNTLTVSPLYRRTQIIEYTSGGSGKDIEFDTEAPVGTRFTVVHKNTAGGASGNIIYQGANLVFDNVALGLTDNQMRTDEWMYMELDGNLVWMMIREGAEVS